METVLVVTAQRGGVGSLHWVEARYALQCPTVSHLLQVPGPQCQPCPLKLSFDVAPEAKLEDSDFGSWSAEEFVHILHEPWR